jgi:hypothetical protein
VNPADALLAGDNGVLVAPRDPVEARLNIGVCTLSNGVNMLVTVRNKSGAQIRTLTKSYGPTFFEQVSAAAFLGIEPGPSDTITFSVNSGSAIVYGATTDNKTQDPAAQIAYPVF